MKAICIKTYFDKVLHRTVSKGEALELSKERFAELSTKNNSEKTIFMKRAEDVMPESQKG